MPQCKLHLSFLLLCSKVIKQATLPNVFLSEENWKTTYLERSFDLLFIIALRVSFEVGRRDESFAFEVCESILLDYPRNWCS